MADLREWKLLQQPIISVCSCTPLLLLPQHLCCFTCLNCFTCFTCSPCHLLHLRDMFCFWTFSSRPPLLHDSPDEALVICQQLCLCGWRQLLLWFLIQFIHVHNVVTSILLKWHKLCNLKNSCNLTNLKHNLQSSTQHKLIAGVEVKQKCAIYHPRQEEYSSKGRYRNEKNV